MEEGIEIVPSAGSNLQRRSSSLSVLTDIKSATAVEVPAKKANNVISFLKDGAGLGFSIEGGKDSPLGDVPLIVKKIFTGGAADKNGQLKVGDEILFINDISFSNLSRMEAWTIMKKVPEGNVSIHIFR
uniref:PDZ domain-containing protein 2 n=1 Tax=Anoplophora glabripennis TaxID=217634 RepID=V5GWN1_ANOGL